MELRGVGDPALNGRGSARGPRARCHWDTSTSASVTCKHHRVWPHPDRELKLYVPAYDLIPDAVGQRILEDAEG